MTTRKYRLHVFDGAYEVLADRLHAVVLDLDTPEAGAVLDNKLVALARAARAAGEPMDAPRLEVRDWATGAKVQDVTA